MALWDSSGILIDQNDDASGTQSAITASLSAGQYTLAITGFNTIFSNGPDYQFINGCSLSGSYVLNIAGAQIISGTIPSGRGHIFTFTIGDPDCDMDGIPDFNELDCDMDGVPDDCQLPTIAGANDAGIVGDSNSTFVFNTCGSDFDTEIAVWDEGGTLLGANDDSSCGLQSEITLQLEPGIYYAVIAGYNAFFSNNFGVEMNVDAECSDGGNLQVLLGDFSDDGDFPSGRAIMVRFEIEESASCLAADINGDGTLNFFDISAFLTLFNSLDPQADFNKDGSFNFFDISAFLSVFSMGC